MTLVIQKYSRSRLLKDIDGDDRPVTFTPLHDCIMARDISTTHVLVRARALVNFESGPEGTPFMAACVYGPVDMVKSIVRIGVIKCYE